MYYIRTYERRVREHEHIKYYMTIWIPFGKILNYKKSDMDEWLKLVGWDGWWRRWWWWWWWYNISISIMSPFLHSFLPFFLYFFFLSLVIMVLVAVRPLLLLISWENINYRQLQHLKGKTSYTIDVIKHNRNSRGCAPTDRIENEMKSNIYFYCCLKKAFIFSLSLDLLRSPLYLSHFHYNVLSSLFFLYWFRFIIVIRAIWPLLKRVKKRRIFVQPNAGFTIQLRLFHKMGWKIDPQHEKYKVYRMRLAADKVRKGKLKIDY